MAAPALAKHIPGPSEADLADMALKKSSPVSSKRVLLPLAAAAGLAFFASDSTLGRLGAAFAGGLAGAYATATAIKLGQVDSTTLAQAAAK